MCLVDDMNYRREFNIGFVSTRWTLLLTSRHLFWFYHCELYMPFHDVFISDKGIRKRKVNTDRSILKIFTLVSHAWQKKKNEIKKKIQAENMSIFINFTTKWTLLSFNIVKTSSVLSWKFKTLSWGCKRKSELFNYVLTILTKNR